MKFKKNILFYFFTISFFFLTFSLIASVTRHYLLKGKGYSLFSDIIIDIAEAPSNVKNYAQCLYHKKKKYCGRFPIYEFINDNNYIGFKYHVKKNEIPKGYILISKYSMKQKQNIIELIQTNGDLINRWTPNVQSISASIKKKPERLMFQHPFLNDDGSILTSTDGPILHLDKCSNLVNIIQGHFHHSIEQDHKKNFWLLHRELKDFDFQKNIANEFIINFDLTNKKIIFKKSIIEILYDNDLQYLVTSANYGIDPLHPNDVQPVLENNEYALQGDVFISLRNISAIILYRPSTNKVLWVKQGPWRQQHDVDILSNNKIGIYDNAVNLDGTKSYKNNNVIIYDFIKNEYSKPYDKIFKKYNINSRIGSLFEKKTNNFLFIEETLSSRILFFSLINNKVDLNWEYYWNANLNWSRYYSDNNIKINKIVNLLKNKKKLC